MIVVRLEGGLGNQLFQYSHGVALKAKYGGKLIFDRRLIIGDPSKEGALSCLIDIGSQSFVDQCVVVLLRIYSAILIRLFVAISGKGDSTTAALARFGVLHTFDSRHVEFRDTKLPFRYAHGNFLSLKYFQEESDNIRAALHGSRMFSEAGGEIFSEIRSSNSVAVHVRRGDYLSERWREKLHVCTPEYYERAVKYFSDMDPDVQFFIFSNSDEDIAWIRANFHFLPEDTVFVPEGLKDVHHFVLMAHCKNFIIANSTFSWWSSYLGRNIEKVIVAPWPWNRESWDMTDIYLENWNVLELESPKAMARAYEA